jgi:uncharacterized alpha-E superfamily protein
MLSRVADALFWMSRYLERAEQVARLVDVCFHLELDLHGVLAGPHEVHWTSLATILQQVVPAEKQAERGSQGFISHWLSFDLDNPSSIMSCVTRARSNARTIRGTINSQMWKELNKLYWQLCDPEFTSLASESPHEFYLAVECGSHVFQGVCDATLTRDEGWQFIQLGKFLERADKTLRILDIHYQLLRDMTGPSDLPMTNLRWAGVLRSCRAYEAYQRLYVGRVDPDRVLEFLLLQSSFPRSVRFSLEKAAEALKAIEGPASDGALSKAGHLLGRLLSELRYGEIEQILRGGLHAFLGRILEGCTRIGGTIQDQYSLRS